MLLIFALLVCVTTPGVTRAAPSLEKLRAKCDADHDKSCAKIMLLCHDDPGDPEACLYSAKRSESRSSEPESALWSRAVGFYSKACSTWPLSPAGGEACWWLSEAVAAGAWLGSRDLGTAEAYRTTACEAGHEPACDAIAAEEDAKRRAVEAEQARFEAIRSSWSNHRERYAGPCSEITTEGELAGSSVSHEYDAHGNLLKTTERKVSASGFMADIEPDENGDIVLVKEVVYDYGCREKVTADATPCEIRGHNNAKNSRGSLVVPLLEGRAVRGEFVYEGATLEEARLVYCKEYLYGSGLVFTRIHWSADRCDLDGGRMGYDIDGFSVPAASWDYDWSCWSDAASTPAGPCAETSESQTITHQYDEFGNLLQTTTKGLGEDVVLCDYTCWHD